MLNLNVLNDTHIWKCMAKITEAGCAVTQGYK